MKTKACRWCLYALVASVTLPAQESTSRAVVFQFEHTFERKQNRDYKQIRIALPVSEPGRQRIHALKLDPPPDRETHTKGKRVAEWKWKDYAPTKTIRVEVAAELFPSVLSQERKEEEGNPAGWGPGKIANWLKPEPFVESEAAAIREMAAAIPEQETLDEWVQTIADQVKEHLTYKGFEAEDQGALKAVQTREGDCTEYADLFTALCRASGLPARSRLCILPRSVDTPLHSVSEVYLPGRGWKIIDPLWGEITGLPQEKLPNRYLLLSLTRNDKDMFGKFSDRVYRKFGKQSHDAIRTTLTVLEKQADQGVKKVKITY